MKNLIEVLKNASDDELREVVSQINSWDGTFHNCELDCFTFDELIELFCCDFKSTRELVIMISKDKPNLDCEWFYFDDYGLNSTDKIDYESYVPEIAEWLCNAAGYAGFPDYISVDIKEAVAKAMNMDIEDL